MRRRSLAEKLLVLGMLVTCLTVLGGTNVQAAGLTEDVEQASIVKDAGVAFPSSERTLLEDADSASDISYIKARSSHLYYGYTQIDKVDYHKVGLIGTTQCIHKCPHVYLTIMIDQLADDGGWSQLRYWDYEEENVDHLTRELEVLVPTGHYYSVRGYHSCIHGNEVETTTTETDGIYIGKTNKPVE